MSAGVASLAALLRMSTRLAGFATLLRMPGHLAGFATLVPRARAATVRAAAVLAAVTIAVCLCPSVAQAQSEYSLFSAYAGFTTGGDTTTAGSTYGFSTMFVSEHNWGTELDISHSNKFNDVSYESTGLTTAMVNVIAVPHASRWLRPYGLFGVGAIRARGCGPNCVREFSRTDLGLDAAGGALVPVNDNFGARADVRYFRYAQIHNDLPRLDNGGFDFWRITFGAYVTW
jgi:opacity protein-like surface antigen